MSAPWGNLPRRHRSIVAFVLNSLRRGCWPTKPLMIFVSAFPPFPRRKSQGITWGSLRLARKINLEEKRKHWWVISMRNDEEKHATHTKRGLVGAGPTEPCKILF